MDSRPYRYIIGHTNILSPQKRENEGKKSITHTFFRKKLLMLHSDSARTETNYKIKTDKPLATAFTRPDSFKVNRALTRTENEENEESKSINHTLFTEENFPRQSRLNQNREELSKSDHQPVAPTFLTQENFIVDRP